MLKSDPIPTRMLLASRSWAATLMVKLGLFRPHREVRRKWRYPQVLPKKLANYKSEATSGVLAPRGWFCFGAYGSSGATLFVAPRPFQMDPDHPFAAISNGFPGPVIELQDTEAGGSGSYAVARVLAHAFPKQKGFVEGVRQDIQDAVELERDLKIGPYPGDRL